MVCPLSLAAVVLVTSSALPWANTNKRIANYNNVADDDLPKQQIKPMIDIYFHNATTGICTRMFLSSDSSPAPSLIPVYWDVFDYQGIPLLSVRRLLGGTPTKIEHTRMPTPMCAPGMDWPTSNDNVVDMGELDDKFWTSDTEQVLVFANGQMSDGCSMPRESVVSLVMDSTQKENTKFEFKWLTAESPACSTNFELRVFGVSKANAVALRLEDEHEEAEYLRSNGYKEDGYHREIADDFAKEQPTATAVVHDDTGSIYFHNSSTGICTRMFLAPDFNRADIVTLSSTHRLLGGSPVNIEHTRAPMLTCAPGMEWPASLDEVVDMGSLVDKFWTSKTEQTLIFAGGQMSDGCSLPRESIVNLVMDSTQKENTKFEFKWLTAESPACSTNFELRVFGVSEAGAFALRLQEEQTDFSSTMDWTAADDEDEDDEGYDDYDDEVYVDDEDEDDDEEGNSNDNESYLAKRLKDVTFSGGFYKILSTGTLSVDTFMDRTLLQGGADGPDAYLSAAERMLLIISVTTCVIAWMFISCKNKQATQPASALGDKLMV